MFFCKFKFFILFVAVVCLFLVGLVTVARLCLKVHLFPTAFIPMRKTLKPENLISVETSFLLTKSFLVPQKWLFWLGLFWIVFIISKSFWKTFDDADNFFLIFLCFCCNFFSATMICFEVFLSFFFCLIWIIVIHILMSSGAKLSFTSVLNFAVFVYFLVFLFTAFFDTKFIALLIHSLTWVW